MSWWNNAYLFRKEIFISLSDTTSDISSLIEVDINLAASVTNKTVNAGTYSDVEVVHESDDATPTQTVLGRSINENGTKLFFESNVALPDTGKFYMYYGNSKLINAPIRPAYNLDLFPLTTNYDGEDVTYTRPNEHWIDGSSFTQNSRATFAFSGSQIKVNGVKGPDAGIASISIDNAEPDEVDLYQNTETDTTIYTKTGLSKAFRHTIAITVTGAQNVSSLGKIVKITSFQHPGAAIALLGGEENNKAFWITTFGV